MPKVVCTVAILAQGTNWADAVTQAYTIACFVPRMHTAAHYAAVITIRPVVQARIMTTVVQARA